MDDMFYYHELCSKEWEQPVKLFPVFPNSANKLCELHEFLLTYQNPVTNICNQLPSVLTQDLRFNVQDFNGYGLFVKRDAPVVVGERRILDHPGARWKSRGGLVNVFNLSQEVIGTKEVLDLVFTDDDDDHGMISAGPWSITEYVSSSCQDGTSAIIVMMCKDPYWNASELAVLEAEENILRFYDDQYRSLIEEGIHKVALGRSISTLMAVRKHIKEVEERNASLKGLWLCF